jgi:hypothetical protein
VKGTHLVATLVALALVLALASCGGDDGQEASAPEAGTSTAAQADSQSEPSTGSDRSESGDVAKGNGGSSVADAERAAPSERAPEQGKADVPKSSPADSGTKQESKRKPRTPAEGLATLSPSERRALHKDLYQQGRTLCYAYGPKELAKSCNLTGNDPQTIAQQYARIYEAATPALILPYQQGCLAGFRKFARNPPKN